MNENVARPIRMRPRSAKPTRNEPDGREERARELTEELADSTARGVFAERELARASRPARGRRR